jgi:hypothetical protein
MNHFYTRGKQFVLPVATHGHDASEIQNNKESGTLITFGVAFLNCAFIYISIKYKYNINIRVSLYPYFSKNGLSEY